MRLIGGFMAALGPLNSAYAFWALRRVFPFLALATATYLALVQTVKLAVLHRLGIVGAFLWQSGLWLGRKHWRESAAGCRRTRSRGRCWEFARRHIGCRDGFETRKDACVAE